ncbi:hypothetical protein BDN72DRAFT_205505 [Pluteus cervinus]|uniref:Uncharacterized protein n=1 Tax=Pluteus cervinus TaxID=181527 RepID=A0ACD3AKC4_9AGAR|nr:hypothetical protein BDN72DRAFT_205505 [Pluteus cervinus]
MTSDNDDNLSVLSLSSDSSVTFGSPELGQTENTTGGQLPDDNFPAPISVPLDRHSDIPLELRHHRFFIPEEFVTLKVDSVYFNIPAFVLRTYSKKFSNSLDGEANIEKELPSLLKDITALDLERFLAVIFPKNCRRWEFTTVDEWTSILKVARQWEAQSVYELALEQIEPNATAVDLVVLGAQYNIPEWLKMGRLGLCRRDEPLTFDEAARMGMEEAIKISAARHHIRPSEVRPDVKDSTILPLLEDKPVNEKLLDSAASGLMPSPSAGGGQLETLRPHKAASSLGGPESRNLSLEKGAELILTHEPQTNENTTRLPSIASEGTTPPDTHSPGPEVSPAPSNTREDSLGRSSPPGDSVTTQSPPTITSNVQSGGITRQSRISRALELRKLLHDLDSEMGKLDVEVVQMMLSVDKKKIEIMNDQANLNEELTILFEGS